MWRNLQNLGVYSLTIRHCLSKLFSQFGQRTVHTENWTSLELGKLEKLGIHNVCSKLNKAKRERYLQTGRPNADTGSRITERYISTAVQVTYLP